MKSIIIFLINCLFLSANAGTYYRTYWQGQEKTNLNSTVPEGQTIWSINFDNIFQLDTRTLESSHIEFEVTANTTGFFGFGFTRAFSSPSDIVMGGFDSATNKPYHFDMYSPEISNELIKDTKQVSDWLLTNSSQDLSKNVTKLTFQRLLKTNDSNTNQDLQLQDEDVYILWYMGEGNDVQGNITRQGSSLLCNLLKGETKNSVPTATASIFLIFFTFILLF